MALWCTYCMGVRNNKTLNSWAPVKRKRLKKPTMKCHSLGETIGAEKRSESGTVTSEWASRALVVKPTPRKIRRSQDPVFLNIKLTYRILYSYFKQYGKQSIGGGSLFYFKVFMNLGQMFRMGGLSQPTKKTCIANINLIVLAKHDKKPRVTRS